MSTIFLSETFRVIGNRLINLPLQQMIIRQTEDNICYQVSSGDLVHSRVLSLGTISGRFQRFNSPSGIASGVPNFRLQQQHFHCGLPIGLDASYHILCQVNLLQFQVQFCESNMQLEISIIRGSSFAIILNSPGKIMGAN